MSMRAGGMPAPNASGASIIAAAAANRRTRARRPMPMMTASTSGTASWNVSSGCPHQMRVAMPPSITTTIIAVPIDAVRGHRRSSAAAISMTPIRIRNHTGKCHWAKSCAHLPFAGNLFRPCARNTNDRSRVTSHSAISFAIAMHCILRVA